MGTDKALLVVDGRPMAVRVAEALAAAGARPIRAVGGNVPGLAAAGLDAVPDQDPGAGPLGGIVTGLGALAGAEIVFVASCDLVAPSPAAIAATVDALAAAPDAAAAVPVDGGRRQWMHAAWRPGAAAAPLRAAFAAGERAVHAACAVGGLQVVEVAVPSAAVADADAPSELPPAGSV
jgi:molybdopterin-guanine dinucleotide biosynthesis protein A